jgi:amidophosphoribosyltransferase
MYAQQHRGQESAGLALTDGREIFGHTGMGLVPEVFDADRLERLERRPGLGAIGHTRYSTTGGSLACNAQPLIESFLGRAGRDRAQREPGER